MTPPSLRVTGESFVTLYTEAGEDIGKGLVEDGLLLVDKKGGGKLASLVRKASAACSVSLGLCLLAPCRNWGPSFADPAGSERFWLDPDPI